ncbi:MAG: CAP domain-containing protein [Bacteroidia bacterium]|jgi:hypothetical protein|nr:CAP domain-containing protein [Bacteroidia bacterium]
MKNSNLLLTFLLVLLIVISCSKEEDKPKTPEQPNTSNNSNARALAKQDYETMFIGTVVPNFSWNGNTATCDAGTLNQEVLNKALTRLHYFRKAAGLSTNNILFIDSLNAKSQQAALMMKANNALSHFPPTSWSCYTQAGADAARNGNIAFGASDVNNIDLWIEDEGNNNTEVGHRRWMLYSRASDFGFGCTNNTATLWVINSNSLSNPIPANTPEFIAWPPKGFIPKQVVYPRWSFSIPAPSYPFQVDFTNTTVTMTNAAGVQIPLTIEYANPISSSFAGDNTLVWRPTGIDFTSTSDQKYTVAVNNVMVDGTSKKYTYEVIIFTP